jgi:hypothetical protein
MFSLMLYVLLNWGHPTWCRPLSPLPLLVAKAGSNHLNKEITPLLPTRIGEQYSQTISNLGQAALFHQCEFPYKRNAELTQGALVTPRAIPSTPKRIKLFCFEAWK